MKERYKVPTAVWICLFRDNEKGVRQILLQLRQNTGYMDGMYDLAASGHVEPGESMMTAAIREAKEEICIDIKPQDLVFLTFVDGVKDGYHKAYFGAKQYTGEPKIMEPDKCKELHWFDLDALPENIIPYLRNVLANIAAGIPFDDDSFTSASATKSSYLSNRKQLDP